MNRVPYLPINFCQLYFWLKTLSCLFAMVNVDWESIFNSSSCLLEFHVVEIFSSETSNSHISGLVGQVLMTNFSRTLSNNSIVEWFRLVELFSILSSILISVGVLLSSPAGTIPEGRVHHVTRAIIQQRLSRAVQIRFILNVLVNMHSFFSVSYTHLTLPTSDLV